MHQHGNSILKKRERQKEIQSLCEYYNKTKQKENNSFTLDYFSSLQLSHTFQPVEHIQSTASPFSPEPPKKTTTSKLILTTAISHGMIRQFLLDRMARIPRWTKTKHVRMKVEEKEESKKSNRKPWTDKWPHWQDVLLHSLPTTTRGQIYLCGCRHRNQFGPGGGTGIQACEERHCDAATCSERHKMTWTWYVQVRRGGCWARGGSIYLSTKYRPLRDKVLEGIVCVWSVHAPKKNSVFCRSNVSTQILICVYPVSKNWTRLTMKIIGSSESYDDIKFIWL